MTTDELIELVARRDKLRRDLAQAEVELEKVERIKEGHYIGTDSRCVRVTGRLDHPSEFTLVHLNQVLNWSA